jgi:diguanylate cyclase (GGDEF)-like protein/PAS domain S-box-containing protein
MQKTWSIRQLFNLVLVVLLVPPSLLLAYSINQRHEEQIKSIHAKSLTLARGSAQDAASLVDNGRSILERLKARPLIRSLDPDRCDPILHDLSQWYSQFANLSTIDRSGQVICNSSSVPGQPLPNYGRREWFGKVFESKSFLIGDPVVGGTTRLWIAPLVQPIFDENGTMIGVLSLTLNLAQFQPKIVHEVVPAGTEVSIVNSSGTYIARSIESKADDWLGQRHPESQLVAIALAQPSDAATSVGSHGDRQLDVVAGVMPVRGTKWHVIATIPTRSIMTGARNSALLNIAAVSLVLTAAVSMAAFLFRNIGRSIASIEAAARAHMRGDATARAAETGAREIVTVARQFNLMLDASRRAEEELLRQKRHLDAAIDNMSQGLLLFDASERVVVCNRRYIDIYGLSPDVIGVGCTFRELLQHSAATGELARDPEQHRADVLARIAEGRPINSLVETRDGREISIVNMPLPNGGWVVTHEDVTERKRAERKLEQTQRFLSTILENAPVPIIVKDPATKKIILINRAYEQFTGAHRDQLIGTTAHDFFSPREVKLIEKLDEDAIQSGRHTIKGELAFETSGGRPRFVTTTRLVVRDHDDTPQHLIVVMEDVTEHRESEARIAHMAHHDLLTGLANRALFLEKIGEAGARLRQSGETFTIFILDLDRFKDCNDSLGHPAGDALLKEVARRLKCLLCETDVLARLGGDEFAVLQAGAVDQSVDAGNLAARMVEAVAEPFEIDESEVVIGASVGIAQAPADGIESSEMMKRADLALYRQKSKGRNGYRFFDAEMMAQADARHQLAGDLRNAISNDELEVHYQPIIDAKTRDPCCVEALVRWRHPRRGNVPPAEFIPLAEENGLIIPIGEWVLQRACADAARLPPHIKMAINLSPVQFKTANLFGVILCALVESGLAPERLELEITESVLIESHASILPVIQKLRNLGISIALDDFGTGYSSLSYLTMFPFDKIKIDQSFTQNIASRSECAAIVSSVLALGRSLDIAMTAEGVETEEQFGLLRAAGVSLVQGYLFGRPCPLAQLDFGKVSLSGAAGANAA